MNILDYSCGACGHHYHQLAGFLSRCPQCGVQHKPVIGRSSPRALEATESLARSEPPSFTCTHCREKKVWLSPFEDKICADCSRELRAWYRRSLQQAGPDWRSCRTEAAQRYAVALDILLSSLLTERERQICALRMAGFKGEEIAAPLFISNSTAKTHNGSILNRLGLTSAWEIAPFCFEVLLAAVAVHGGLENQPKDDFRASP